jgi:hypothetical protein
LIISALIGRVRRRSAHAPTAILRLHNAAVDDALNRSCTKPRNTAGRRPAVTAPRQTSDARVQSCSISCAYSDEPRPYRGIDLAPQPGARGDSTETLSPPAHADDHAGYFAARSAGDSHGRRKGAPALCVLSRVRGAVMAEDLSRATSWTSKGQSRGGVCARPSRAHARDSRSRPRFGSGTARISVAEYSTASPPTPGNVRTR